MSDQQAVAEALREIFDGVKSDLNIARSVLGKIDAPDEPIAELYLLLTEIEAKTKEAWTTTIDLEVWSDDQ